MSELTFEEKVKNGVFEVSYLKNLREDLSKRLASGEVAQLNRVSAKSKIKAIDEYLKSQYTSAARNVVRDAIGDKPVSTTSKTISVTPTEKSPTGGDVEVTDEFVARKFLQVKESAAKRGIDFSLSLTSVKNLLKAKKCHYSGLLFDHKDAEKSLTFDRVDHRKGYVKGNVVACMKATNDLKNILIEHPVSVFKDNPKLLSKVVKKWILEK